jgi:hypothetical protein
VDDAAIVTLKLNPAKPTREHVVTKLSPKAGLNTPPFIFD